MGKKMKLPFLSKKSQATPSWPWPSCKNPKTLSFRSTGDMSNVFNTEHCQFGATCTNIDDDIGKYVNNTTKHLEPDTVWLEGQVEEEIIDLRSDDRLIFDPGEALLILEDVKNVNSPFKESVAMVMDSQDPCVDFKKSMDEMVEAHGLRDWENLEKLLNWYLRVNDKNTHGYVIGAFVDLLVGLNFTSLSLGCSNDDEYHGESTSSNSPNDSIFSPLSISFSTFSTSPCLSSLELVENDVEKEVNSGSSQMLWLSQN